MQQGNVHRQIKRLNEGSFARGSFEVANADEIQTYEIPYPHNFPYAWKHRVHKCNKIIRK